MITSSEFFKKTFFDIQLDEDLKISNNYPKRKKIPSNKTALHRYLDQNYSEQKHIQCSSNNMKSHQKNYSSLSHTKSQLNQHFNQFQIKKSQKNCDNKPNFDQFTIDVTPWSNYTSSLTSRELYDTKQNLNKQREKIKSTIQKYKFARTIEESDQEHANFINTPRKNKKINFILYQYEKKRNQKGNRKPINMIKNIDINKTYEKYLNDKIEFDKDFLFRSHTKIKTHNRKEGETKKIPSRQEKEPSSIEDSSSKQFIDNVIKKDLICCQYLQEQKNQKTKKFDTQMSNKSNWQEESICCGMNLSERKRIVEKVKSLRYEINRRILKSSKISMNGDISFGVNPLTERPKLCLEVSGNKTRKLEYSFVSS